MALVYAFCWGPILGIWEMKKKETWRNKQLTIIWIEWQYGKIALKCDKAIRNNLLYISRDVFELDTVVY